MGIRGIFGRPIFKGSPVTRRPVALAPLRLPSLLTAENVTSFLKYNASCEYKLVFHKQTKTLAIGNVLDEHHSNGSSVIDHPDISVKGHQGVIGGSIAFKTMIPDKLYRFKVDALSGFYGYKSDALNEVVAHLKDIFLANHYKVKNEDSAAYPNGEKAIFFTIKKTKPFTLFC